jgi:uncharacterized alpha/beta hydrolase family protein
MKKLTFSLMVAIFTAIIFFGWGLDTFFNKHQEQKIPMNLVPTDKSSHHWPAP